jgi:hypothetical protein
VIAAILWLKTRAGWKETSVQELAARDDKPLVIFRTIVEPGPTPANVIEHADTENRIVTLPRVQGFG